MSWSTSQLRTTILYHRLLITATDSVLEICALGWKEAFATRVLAATPTITSLGLGARRIRNGS